MVNVDDRSERKGWVYIGYTHDRLSRRLCGNHRGLLHEDKDIAHYKFTIEAVAKFEKIFSLQSLQTRMRNRL